MEIIDYILLYSKTQSYTAYVFKKGADEMNILSLFAQVSKTYTFKPNYTYLKFHINII